MSRPRRNGLVVALAALLVSASAVVAVTRPWDRSEAPRVPASLTAAQRIKADPLLSQLVWVTGETSLSGPARIQSLRDQPSLRFPAGVDFDQAFQGLLSSLASDGALPAEAVLGPPLPRGKTLALPEGPGQGIAIDLRAARSYLTPSGILPTGFAAAPSWSPEEAERRVRAANQAGLIVPPGAVIPTPMLEACQILDPKNPSPPCQLSPPLR